MSDNLDEPSGKWMRRRINARVNCLKIWNELFRAFVAKKLVAANSRMGGGDCVAMILIAALFGVIIKAAFEQKMPMDGMRKSKGCGVVRFVV